MENTIQKGIGMQYENYHFKNEVLQESISRI
jgi:hypothetical protein